MPIVKRFFYTKLTLKDGLVKSRLFFKETILKSLKFSLFLKIKKNLLHQ